MISMFSRQSIVSFSMGGGDRWVDQSGNAFIREGDESEFRGANRTG